MSAEVKSVRDLLLMELRVPGYQRPYRWTMKNVSDLLADVDAAVVESMRYPGYRYRIGSVILHNNEAEGCYDIVDGQQRILSLLLLMLYLDPAARFPLLEKCTFSHAETQRNMRDNYALIEDWCGYQMDEWHESVIAAFSDTLEAVVIVVNRIEEAFQLFDSQNTRGRGLDPHDLLKAYHLRAMREDPYGMRHVVTRWEEFSADEVRELFARFLFPVTSWKLKEKTVPFTTKEIDAFKGVGDRSGYAFADRARRAAPCFQVGESFVEGEDFFLMAEHYLRMRRDIESELGDNRAFAEMNNMLKRKRPSAGFMHARNLFHCALFAYYDRFHNFDVRAVRKLFTWSMMIRVDIQSLGFDTINKYAVGGHTDQYSNEIAMFAQIARARTHTEVADIPVKVRRSEEFEGMNEERRELGAFLLSLSGGGRR